MGRLTESKIRGLQEAGRYGDGDGLVLNVTPSLAKSWIVRLKVKRGRRRDVGIGPYTLLPLKEARIKAWEYRKRAYDGDDPLTERLAKTLTFEKLAMQYYEEHKPKWKPGRHTDRWMDVLKLYAFPVFGDKPVNQIERADLLQAFKPIWESKAESARKTKQRVRAVLQWCLGSGFVDVNVADQIDGVLPSMPSVKEHHRAFAV